jgi:CubicO group peptidase (beta-lactamase class C family)
MGSDFTKADRLMQEAVDQGVFPGAVLLVATQGAVVFERAYGMANLFSRQTMTVDTWFDLASLTKPLATVLVAMRLVQQGHLDLDRSCGEYWPPLATADKGQITLRHLLNHHSGLPAWRPYYLRLKREAPGQRMQMLQQAVLSEPLGARPGARAEYSDVGFLVVQWILQTVTGLPLDLLFQSLIIEPLKITRICFNDLARGRLDRPFAATELCPLRGRLLAGEVHDDNAHLLGGVAGHAGLFGTTGAVWALLQGLLNADQGQSVHPLFDRALIQHFFQPQPHGTWALGFDTPSLTNSSAGQYFGPGSVGHLGYTGTSFWMAREQAVIVLLFTNRVHPTRYNDRIRPFRPRLHDAIMQTCLGAGE